jgi:hypothetical protein
MANYLLLMSSIAMAIIQLYTNYLFRPPVFFALLGIMAFVTSIWNHGTTNEIARQLDRIYMVIYILTNIVIIYSVVKDPLHILGIYLIMASGIACVLVAMTSRQNSVDKDIHNPYRIHKTGNYYHLYAHCVVMIVHSILCFRLVEDCDVNMPVFCNDNWIEDFSSMMY